MPIIHVIRHGQTDYNLEGRYQGSVDVPLNAVGRAQAAALSEELVRLAAERVFCSPLRRVMETAEIIAGRLGVPISVEPRLAERSLGVYEGLTREEAAARYPELYALDVTRAFDSAPTGGETPRQVCGRVSAALDDIVRSIDGRQAIVISHGFVAKAIDRHFNPEKDERSFFAFSLKNGEVVTYRF